MNKEAKKALENYELLESYFNAELTRIAELKRILLKRWENDEN